MTARNFRKYPLRADETVKVLKTQAAKALVGPAGQVRLAALTPRVLDTAAAFIEAHAEIFEHWVAAGSSYDAAMLREHGAPPY